MRAFSLLFGCLVAWTARAEPLETLWEFATPDRPVIIDPFDPHLPPPRSVSYIFSTPAVDPAGRIYFGAANRNFYCLSPYREVLWVFPTGGEIQASPAIGADGTVYFGSGDRKFYALDTEGKEKWHFETSQDVHGSPALAEDGTIYFGSRDCKLYAMNPDGTLKWSFATGGYVERSAVLTGDGTIYFGSFDAKIYALNPDGTKKWSVSTGQESPAGALVGSLALGSDGTIYASTGGDGQQLLAISASGEVLWSYKFAPPQVYSYSSAPAIGADGVLYVGAADRTIHAINPDGSPKWSTFTGSYGFSAPSLSEDGLIYIAGESMNLFVLHPSGMILTNFAMPGPGASGGTVSAPNLTANRKLYVGSGNGKLYAFRTSGELQTSAWPTAQANSQRTARAPILKRTMRTPRATPEVSIRFEISVFDSSMRIETSTDLREWKTVPFTREGSTITVRREPTAESAFYRVHYAAGRSTIRLPDPR